MHDSKSLSAAVASATPMSTRRRWLLSAAALVVAPMVCIPRAAHATSRDLRTLAFHNTHTGEALDITYAAAGSYIADALARVDRLLRDFRTGDVHPIDPALLDQLHTLATATGTRAPFEIISGYRSPATNAALQRHGGGVATHSLHLQGRAIDIRLADVPLPDLRDAALSLRAGGVGFYAQSQFVHLDTGAIRRW